MNRRDCLKLISAIVMEAYAQQVFSKPNKTENITVLLDQSGTFGRGYMVIGVMTCNAPEKVAQDIKEIRNKLNFRCQLMYHSRNKWQGSYAKNLIDYWLSSNDIHIHLIAIRNTKSDSAESTEERDRRYIDQLAIPIIGAKNRPLKVVTQQRYSVEREKQFESHLVSQINNIPLITVKHRENDLIQFLGYITGLYYGTYPSDFRVPTNKVKLELISFLSQKINIGTTKFWDASAIKLNQNISKKLRIDVVNNA